MRSGADKKKHPKLLLMKLLPLAVLAACLALVSCQNGNQRPLSQKEPSAPPTLLNQRLADHQGDTILLGPIDRHGLEQPPFSAWFDPGYRQYRVDAASLEGLAPKLQGVDILVFLGTWCSDSQYEIPHLFKILDHLGYDSQNLTMVALSNQPDFYKRSPQGEEENWNIEYVPTVILLKEGNEIGRITESPLESLEIDLSAMLR
jgi:thiol-disulfide isomerase/thioredoxin